MRIWDLPVEVLCRQHLLGEHVELHIMFKAISKGYGGWYNHIETRRWHNKMWALFNRHSEQVVEMEKRGYNHNSPLELSYSLKDKWNPNVKQDEQWQTTEKQIELLRERCSNCKV